MLGGILWLVFWPAIFAIFLVVGLEVFDRFFFTPIVAPHIFPAWSKLSSQIDASALTTTVSTLAQIAGVFLGLYFTAVSVIASTIYAKVPGDVRSLLVEERLGNFYIRFVALLGAVSVILLAASSLGYDPGIFSIVLVNFLGVVSILSFVVLGQRTFYFFDPTRLAGFLVSDIDRWIRLATPKGYQWLDGSFQAHYQQQAGKKIQTLRNVVSLASEKEYQYLQGEPLSALISSLLLLSQRYADQKGSIPTLSNWFKSTYEHRGWFTSSDSRVNIAVQTRTGIEPEIVHDPLWFEKETEEVLLQTFRVSFERNDAQSAVSVSSGVQVTLEVMAEHFLIGEALHLFRVLAPLVKEFARKGSPTLSPTIQDQEEFIPRIAVLDLYGLGFISILLGLFRELEKITAESFDKVVRSLEWSKSETLYKATLPRQAIEQIEYLQKRIIFEKSVEGKTVSPSWYQEQIIAIGFLRFVSESVELLVGELETSFAVEAEALYSEKHFFPSAQVTTRGLEACGKSLLLIKGAKSCCQRLSAVRRVSDIPWKESDWDALAKRVSRVEERLVIVLGECAAILSYVPRSKSLPDYFGQGYSILAQECYQAMVQGNEQLFEKIFPLFFVSALNAFDRLRRELSNADGRTQLIWSSESIDDLLELSGYAIIYSELDDKSFWKVAKKQWDEYLALPDRGNRIESLSAIVDFRESIFAIKPRDITRTGWQQILGAVFRERGLIEEDFGSTSYNPKSGNLHPSAIVRAAARRGLVLFYTGTDVFLAVYIHTLPDASSFSFPKRSESFSEALDDEVANASQNDHQ